MNDAGYIGRLVGRSVSELYFRAFRDTGLSLGGILIAHDESSGRKFLLRVTDVTYGHESGEANWAEKAAGRMLEQDLSDSTYRVHDPDRRLYKIARCSPLGYVTDGRFHRPRSLPSHFAPVSLPDAQTMSFLKTFTGDLPVGYLRCGEEILDIQLGIDGSALAYHLGIFATTGMGKSNLMKVLAGRIMESRAYGLLIFDPHGEYFDGGTGGMRRGLMHHPHAAERLKTYSLRKLRDSSEYSSLTISAREIDVEDITQIFSFSPPQYEALHALRYVYGDRWLFKLYKSDMADLSEELKEKGLNFFDTTLSVIKRRAQRLGEFRTVNFDKDISNAMGIVRKLQDGYTVLIDTANLSQAEETLVTTVLTRAVLNSYRYAYQDGDNFATLAPCLILLEEAQRVLGSSGGDSNIFHQVVREGRKFKVGMGVVTQQPKLLSEELLSQLNSIFILGLADERDRAIVRSSAKQDISALGTEIQTLAAGEALLTSPTVPFALPLKIYLYEQYLEGGVTHIVRRPASRPTEGFFD